MGDLAVLRCCGVAEKQSVDNQVWSLALAPALDCSYPARSLGNPSAAITSEEGSTRTGRVALCKPGGPLAHRQLAPGKLPHQWVLQRVLFGSAFHSSQLPNSEGEQRTTLREHSINRNPGLVRRLSLHDVMESWKWKIYEMRWERIRKSSTTTTNCSWIQCTRHRHWGVVPRQPSRLLTRSAETQKVGTLGELLQ